jgi:pimeloyl-ACP methyl ester carboxylesterase
LPPPSPRLGSTAFAAFMALASTDTRSRRPSLRLTLTEAVALVRPAPKLQTDDIVAAAPRGDGHSILVLPALARGDPYTAQVRDFLTKLGYATHGWNLGVNIGPTKRLLDGAADRLAELSDRDGPVSIVGFSMGGLFARWLAMRMPDRVRQVITVCSPIHRAASNFWLPAEPLLGMWSSVDVRELANEVARPLPVPTTILFSRDDGLVNWHACLDAACPENNIEIGGPHVLIARNPQVMRILAERLGRCSMSFPA